MAGFITNLKYAICNEHEATLHTYCKFTAFVTLRFQHKKKALAIADQEMITAVL